MSTLLARALTKSDYLQFQACPGELWLQWHHPEHGPAGPSLVDRFQMEQGQAVDRLAGELFLEADYLRRLGWSDYTVLLQEQFATNGLVARPDILLRHPDGHYLLLEVKAKKNGNTATWTDIAFQQFVLETAGLEIRDSYLVHLNGEYTLDGELQPERLLRLTLASDFVRELLPDLRKRVREVFALLNDPTPPELAAHRCTNKGRCAYLRYRQPDFPTYSVLEISRLGPKKKKQLLDREIWHPRDVPADFPLTPKQRRQVEVARANQPHIDPAAIQRVLATLEYPLYFLDYEALSHPIPFHPGLGPYDYCVFQFSLHVQEAPDAPLRHYDYLQPTRHCGMTGLIERLTQHIDPARGRILVWNKSFENQRHVEMARWFPAYAEFLQSLIERTFDLRDVFTEQHYCHPQFYGQTSLKAVWPVFATEDPRYDQLPISNGMLAARQWFYLTAPDPELDPATTQADLLAYCHLDTLAMVRILAGCEVGAE